MDLFDQTKAAYDDAVVKSQARDAAAIKAQARKDAAEKAYAAECEAANAELALAQQAHQKAAEVLAALQAQIGALMGKVMPPTDGRVRQSR